MKINRQFTFLPIAILSIISAGCTTQDEHWNQRVGHFTYQQAVNELGQPSSQKTLADGNISAEWVSHYNASATSPEMDSSFYEHAASFAHTDDTTRESKLNLTFTTNNILTGWSKD